MKHAKVYIKVIRRIFLTISFYFFRARNLKSKRRRQNKSIYRTNFIPFEYHFLYHRLKIFKYGHFPSFAVFIAAYMRVTVVIVLKKISVHTVKYKSKKIRRLC